MTTSYLDLINRGAQHHRDRTAIVFGDATLTFTEVDELSSQLAHALASLGANRGSTVALLMNNGLYSVPMDFACVKGGINRVPINSRLSLSEHVRMLMDTHCQTLVFAPDLIERATALQEQIPGLVTHGLGVSMEGGVDLLDEASRHSKKCPKVGVQPTDYAVTLFTSGTTGTLKAAQHTQASYAAVCQNIFQNFIDIAPDDSMLHAASLIHASGVFVLPFWLRGARTVIMPGFDPQAYLQLIQKEKITSVNMVPTMLQMLLDHPSFQGADLSSLRHIIYGASPMPRPVIEKAISLLGQHRFWQYFGQTEFPLAIAALRPEDHVPELLGACGRPSIDVEIRLVDEAGNDVPDGKEGEIAVRGPSMMAGYFNAPALNQEMFFGEGWLRTRDVGIFDERGFLHLKDRTSDMIISGGYNVYPREVEDVLLAHPAVAECAVVGLKDPKWVEVVTAVVVLKPGQVSTESELINFVAAQVASYKKPQKVIFVSALPKTLIGKINRRMLREELAAS
ncbi:AMP-binding protein [Pseudomonas sp. AA-38]|uniref:class I adenylate-forming enzyme family protein n=1 Tax=Pseudomonas sp. AA-38 TaxID=3028807 RepID=UPI0023F70B13|nr:AMP-binding protein [Pseudomonas sp. AA-38]